MILELARARKFIGEELRQRVFMSGNYRSDSRPLETLYCAIDNVYLFKTLSTPKDKKKFEVLVVFHDEFIHALQCYSIKCKIANHKYCVLREKLFTSGDIEPK